jgi:hypothetical protein
MMLFRSPSPLVKFSLLNVIYAYAYALRYFGGFDPDNLTDFVALCFDVSANLREGQNFDSAEVAVESAASAANQVTHLFSRLFNERRKKVLNLFTDSFKSKDSFVNRISVGNFQIYHYIKN